MTVDVPLHIRALKAFKERSEKVAAEAKRLADSLRAKYARQVLHESFPGYQLAIFARYWVEDEPGLIQLLSAEDRPDLELTKDAADFDGLPQEKKQAVIDAEREIIKIGSDDDTLEHLDPGAEEHQGWGEFVLYLDPEREGAVPA